MKMIKVKSSNIESIGYDEILFQLFVEFKATDRSEAKIFIYEDVNHVEFNSLLQAESVGKFFHSTIKAVKEGRLCEPKKSMYETKMTKEESLGWHVKTLIGALNECIGILESECNEDKSELRELIDDIEEDIAQAS